MLRVVALGVLATASAMSAIAPAVNASTGYRYWSYWNAAPETGSWTYATQGSGTHVPVDGAVEGWRFGVAGETSLIQPRTLPDFEAVCGGVRALEDAKRVAVVIDPGEVAEAPEGQAPTTLSSECVVGVAGATGLQLLQSIAEVRMNAGFVCGIDGYPAGECAPLVDTRAQAIDAEASASAQTADATQGVERASTPATSIGSPMFTAAVVSLLAVIGFGLWRRNRRSRV